MSGNVSRRLELVTASPRNCPVLMYWTDEGAEPNITWTCPPSKIGDRRTGSAVRDMNHVDAGHHFEQLSGQMRCGRGAAGRHAQFAGVLFRIGDELGNGPDLGRGMQQDDARHPNKPADCTNVVDEIEIELIEYRSVD